MAADVSDNVLVEALVDVAEARADGLAWLTAHRAAAADAVLAGVEIVSLTDEGGGQAGTLTVSAPRKLALVKAALARVAGSEEADDGFYGTDYSTREVRT